MKYKIKFIFIIFVVLILGTVTVMASRFSDDRFDRRYDSRGHKIGNIGISRKVNFTDFDGNKKILVFRNGLLIDVIDFVVNDSYDEPNADFPNEGLIAYYNADTNGSFEDLVGDKDGNISGAVYSSNGLINGSYSFDGSDDYIDLGNEINSIIGSGTLTVNMWLYIDTISSGNRRPLYMGQASSSDGFLQIASEGGGITSYAKISGTTSISSSDLYTGRWYMATLKRSGTTGTLYVNGEQVDTEMDSNWGANINSGTSETILGSELIHGLYYDGLIDEVGIWNRSLSVAEIEDLYNSGEGLTYAV